MKVEIFIPAQCFEIDGVPDDDNDIAVALIESWASDKARRSHLWWKKDICTVCGGIDRICRKCGSGRCIYCCECDAETVGVQLP